MEYHPSAAERNVVLRYLLAIRKNDAEQIAYFEKFGDSVHTIILNVSTYERGLLFGYTTVTFDKYGWIHGIIPIIEAIELDMLNTIHIGQSPNGLYAVTISWNTGGAGGGSFPSVWNEPFADYREGVKHGITELEKRYAYALEHSKYFDCPSCLTGADPLQAGRSRNDRRNPMSRCCNRHGNYT